MDYYSHYNLLFSCPGGQRSFESREMRANGEKKGRWTWAGAISVHYKLARAYPNKLGRRFWADKPSPKSKLEFYYLFVFIWISADEYFPFCTTLGSPFGLWTKECIFCFTVLELFVPLHEFPIFYTGSYCACDPIITFADASLYKSHRIMKSFASSFGSIAAPPPLESRYSPLPPLSR